jgi:hypothetical protein
MSAKQKLTNLENDYIHHSKEFSEILKKIEYTNKTRTIDFYDERLFKSMNSKMKLVSEKAREVKSKTEEQNILISKFRERMEIGIKDFEEMEDQRVQSIIDSLNEMNIFQTNCEMNNKYDSNNFNEEVEHIEIEDAVFEYKKLLKEIKLIDMGSYQFQPYDELITEEDIEMHEISQEKENEYKDEIIRFINSCTTNPKEITSKEIDKFAEMMNVKINRYLFANSLSKLASFELPGEKCYSNLTKLVMAFLKGCNKNDDSDFLKSMLTSCSKLYYDVEEEEDAVIRTHITEGIRKNRIWDNPSIWGKAIFKDFRDIIRKFRIPEDQEHK